MQKGEKFAVSQVPTIDSVSWKGKMWTKQKRKKKKKETN